MAFGVDVSVPATELCPIVAELARSSEPVTDDAGLTIALTRSGLVDTLESPDEAS